MNWRLFTYLTLCTGYLACLAAKPTGKATDLIFKSGKAAKPLQRTNMWTGSPLSALLPPTPPASTRARALPLVAVPPAPKTNWLVWSNHNSWPVRFEVWHTLDLTKPFTLVTNTAASNFPFFATLPAEFFKVRATNQWGVSEWATK